MQFPQIWRRVGGWAKIYFFSVSYRPKKNFIKKFLRGINPEETDNEPVEIEYE